jgi:nucleoid-associated protein YgaU
MRKDVHIGLAIGGVLLAVLVVWGIVVSGTKKNKSAVTLDTTSAPDSTAPPAASGDHTLDLTPAPTTGGPVTPATATPAASDATASDTPAPAVPDKKEANWAAILTGDGKLPEPLTTATPPLAASTVTPKPGDSGHTQLVSAIDTSASGSTAAAPADSSANDATPTAGSAAAATSAAAAAAPTPTASSADSSAASVTTPPVHSHTVQRGETFSSISKAVYGDARYYNQIAQANPKINPNRLRPGTVITIPDISQVKSGGQKSSSSDKPDGASSADSAPAPAAKPAAPLDSQTQYRVVANDSLYRISVRLYGSGEEIDHLYELNKAVIGPDRAKLKVGMVLKLPGPPTATATASR